MSAPVDAIKEALDRARQGSAFEFYRQGAAPEPVDLPDPTFGETLDAAVKADSIVNTAVRETVGRLAIETDPEYVPPEFGTPEFELAAEGVPEEYWPRLANARSAQHAQYIKQNIREELDAVDTLNRAGWGGTGLRVATAVLDPPALALALTSGGASILATGGRAARAAKLGAVAGAENVALEGALYGLRETKDADDLFYALVGGAVAGAGIGAILPAAKRAKVYEAGKRLRDGDMVADAVGEALELESRSVGASEATMRVEDLGEASKEVLANAPPRLKGVEAKLRYDWHARLMKSENEYARYAADRLVADPVGQRGVAQEASAEEYRRLITRTSIAKFARPAYRAVQEALRGVPLGRRAAAEDEFYAEVTRRVMREQFDDSPAGRAAAGMADAIEAAASAAKRFGVPGFDTLELHRGYVPHIPSGSKIEAALTRFGSEQVERTLAEAFARTTDIEAKYARRIAKGYITGVRNRHAGVHSDFFIALSDKEMIGDLMRKAGAGEDEIAETLGKLKALGAKDESKAGKPARAKRRLGIDETYVARLKDNAGESVDFSVMDLFETDARFLTQLYASTVGGHAAMARAGFAGQKDWDNFIREMQRFERDRLGGTRGGRVNDEVRLLQQTRDHILGRPLIDYSKSHNAAIFAARDWAFVAQSGSFWAAQGSELMAVLSSGGIRMTLKAVPELKSIFTRAVDGTLENATAREMEALLAPGVDALLDSVLGRFSVGVEEGAVNVADKLRRTYGVRHTLKKVAGYANLLTPLTTGMQRVESVFVAQRVINQLVDQGGRGFSDMRLRTLGLTADMEKRVAAQLKKHATFERDIPKLNAEAWTDLDARDAFALAVQRETDRTVLTPTLGASIPFTRTSEFGKALTQFMTFAIQAHTRLLMHGVKHADAERAALWLLGTGMAAALYVARTHLESVGKKDRKKFLRERLASDEIAKAAFARAGFSAMVPTMYDTAAHFIPGVDPVFSHARTTGLGTSLGNAQSYPAGAAAIGAVNALGSLDDGKFTQTEWRGLQRLLPFARVIGIQQGLEILGRELPEKR